MLRCQCVNAVCSARDHQAIAAGTSVLFGPKSNAMDVEILVHQRFSRGTFT